MNKLITMKDENHQETKNKESILLRYPGKNTELLPHSEIYASNLKSFPFHDIGISTDIVSSEESEKLIREIDNNKWVKSISRGRRHQSYICTGNEWIEKYSNHELMKGNAISEIVEFLIEETKKRTNGKISFKNCNEIFIEEIRGAQVGGDVLETEDTCRCLANECTCFVAEYSLLNHGVLIFRKPRERSNSCLDCPSFRDTRILVPRNSLLVRTGDCLFHWRSTLCSDGQYACRGLNHSIGILLPNGYGNLIRDDTYRRISIKLRSINVDPRSQNASTTTDNLITSPKYNPILENEKLRDLLTIVVTTSPIQSNPSLELLQTIFDTFHLAGTEFAFQCNKIIICDGVRLSSDSNVTRKHSNAKQALRNGITNDQQAVNYRQFKDALKDLCGQFRHDDDHSPLPSPFCHTKVVELQERMGYGFALREAIRHVQTPYVCVIQHDRTFMRKTPIAEVVQSMVKNPKIKYVGMSMRSNLMYRDIFVCKYAKNLHEEFDQMILHPDKLKLSSDIYGKEGLSARNIQYEKESLYENLQSLKNSYFQSKQAISHEQWCMQNDDHDTTIGKTQLSLTPTLFWYDNTHVAATAHYRDFIFHPKYKMVKKGGFVEDKVSPNIIKTVERLGLKLGHERFGSYLLDDHSGFFFTGHLDGGSYLIKTEKLKILSSLADKNAEENLIE